MLTPDRPLPQAPFAAFATRQVFEQVEDMRGFLLAIRANLTPQAVGLVEVPNLDTLVAQGRFFDFKFKDSEAKAQLQGLSHAKLKGWTEKRSLVGL